jgi:hypothetical protein
MELSLTYIYSLFFNNIISIQQNLLKFTSVFLLLLLIFYGYHIWTSYNYFKKQGIKTPKYSFILGNLKKLLQNKNDSSQVQEWSKEFGKTYGFVLQKLL